MRRSLSRAFLAAALAIGVATPVFAEDAVEPISSVSGTTTACPAGSASGSCQNLIKDGICPVDIVANIPGPVGSLASVFAKLPFRSYMPPVIAGRAVAAGILQAQSSAYAGPQAYANANSGSYGASGIQPAPVSHLAWKPEAGPRI